MTRDEWPALCVGCIYFNPIRAKPCGILSGGQCIQAPRCSVRDPAPDDIWAARVREYERLHYAKQNPEGEHMHQR